MKQDEVEFLNLFGTQSLIVPFKDKNKSPTEIPKKPKTLKPDNVRSAFGAMNTEGDYGLFFLVNTSKSPTRRKLDDITSCRAVWVEDDTTGKERTDWPIQPNIVVYSSEGKFHYYWLTRTEDTVEHQEVMQTLVNEYNCDPNARDISRILRIPGFYNNKYDPPFLVKYKLLKKKKYSWEEITKAFPPTVIKKENRVESGENANSFDLGAAIQSIVKGENYHNSMTSIAMHYANYGMGREAIKKQLLALQPLAPDDRRAQDRFTDQHLYECIDSGLKRVEGEKASTKAEDVVTEEEFKSEFHIETPKLDRDVLMPKQFLFGELVEAIYWSSFQRNIMSAFIAAATTVSYLAGGSYRQVGFKKNDSLKLAVQQVGLGGSGCGKDPIIKAPMKVINAAFADDESLLEELTQNHSTALGSRQGIEDCLLDGNRHDFLQLSDECGSFFAQALQKPGTPMAELHGFLLETFSAENVGSRKLAKSKAQKGEPTVGKVLYNMCIVFAGASTPERFAQGMSGAHVTHGAAGRMLVHNCGVYFEPRKYDDEIKKITAESLGESLVNNLKVIADHSRIVKSMPLKKGSSGPSGAPLNRGLPIARSKTPTPVHIDSEETDRFFFDNCVEYYQKMEESESKKIWSRFDINSRTVASLIAILEDPVNPVVTLEMAKIAIQVVKSSCEYQAELFSGELMAESVYGKIRAAITEVLKEHYPKPVSKTVLKNAKSVIKNAKVYDKDAAYAEMLDEGIIEEVRYIAPGARKPTTAFKWVGVTRVKDEK